MSAREDSNLQPIVYKTIAPPLSYEPDLVWQTKAISDIKTLTKNAAVVKLYFCPRDFSKLSKRGREARWFY